MCTCFTDCKKEPAPLNPKEPFSKSKLLLFSPPPQTNSSNLLLALAWDQIGDLFLGSAKRARPSCAALRSATAPGLSRSSPRCDPADSSSAPEPFPSTSTPLQRRQPGGLFPRLRTVSSNNRLSVRAKHGLKHSLGKLCSFLVGLKMRGFNQKKA